MILAPPQPAVPESSVTYLVEQYKAYLEDLGNIGSRQAQTTTWYVSILSALMIFISYLAQSQTLHLFAYASIAASAVVAIIICILWNFHALSYQYLYNAKFGVLHEMERTRLTDSEQTGSSPENTTTSRTEGRALPFACYTLENQLLNPRRIRFTSIERRLSLILIFPFGVILLFAIFQCLAGSSAGAP